MTATLGKVERRRYQRYNLKLDAVLICESGPIPCVILDFCSGGMFLELSALDRNIIDRLNHQVQVNFSIGGGSRDQYQVRVQIARVCANGVGVAFQTKPAAALSALQKQALPDLQTSPEVGSNVSSLSANKQKSLQESLLAVLQEYLPQISSDFFLHIDDTLTQASETAESFDDQNACEEAGSSLKLAKESIADAFCKAVLHECQALFDATAKKTTRFLSTTGRCHYP